MLKRHLVKKRGVAAARNLDHLNLNFYGLLRGG